MYFLKLLGAASLEGSSGLVTGRAGQGRRLALLAVLTLGRGRLISRDKLVALLWPESSAERARPQLSDAVYVLRTALGDDLIQSAGDALALNPAAITSDLVLFERARAEGRFEEAVALYRGPLLDGFHISDAVELEHWLDGERSQLDRQYAAALEGLAEAAEATGLRSVAVEWWRRRAAHDPCNGRVALRLLRAFSAAGERTAAFQHARVHTRLLREEFDSDPDAEIVGFLEALRHDPRPAPQPAPIEPTATASMPPTPKTPPDPHESSDSTASPTVHALVAGILIGVVLALSVARRSSRTS